MDTPNHHVTSFRRAGTWQRRLGCCAVLLFSAAAAWAQPVPDEDTLLLLGFDGSANADYSVGTPTALTATATMRPTGGRFGGGAEMAEGDRITLVGDDGNFHAPEGTIEFWIKPHWPGNDPETHRLLSCPMGDAKGEQAKYLNANSLGGGRFGFAIAAGEGDGWKWSRADADVSDWKAHSWHHVAFVWGRGQMRVFVDGQEGRRSVAAAPMPDVPPAEIHITGADAVIDAVRISKRMVTAEQVRRSIDQADSPPYRYLSDLDWTPPDAVTTDKRVLLGDVGIPLILGSEHYPKSIACPAGTSVSGELNGAYGTLVGQVGVGALSPPDAVFAFEVSGDGKRLFDSGPRTADQSPMEIRVPIAGVKTVTLTTKAETGGLRSGHGIWAGAVVRPDAEAKPLFSSRTLKPAIVDMYRRQEAADDFAFASPTSSPYFVTAKFWEDDIDPARPPASESLGRPLGAFATPGEYEPVNFVVYANGDLENVSVEVTDLRAGGSVLAADVFDVRLVLRRLMRNLYTRPPEQSVVVSRFLLPYQELDIPAGTFREYHMIVHVPEGAAPGSYAGTVRIAPANQPPQELPIAFEVLPFELRPPTGKAYGVYYRFPAADADWSQVEVELADIRDHGGTILKSNLGIDYELVEEAVSPSLARLERGLALLEKHGFRGALPVSTGCEHAARLLGYDPVADYDNRPARERFFQVVNEAMEGLIELSSRHPEFEFLPTHMDEVFGRDRLDRYIRLTEAVRQVPSLRVYITLHNDPKRDVSDMMRRCDPFVDVRCYNGHCMDSWIRAGSTFDDLRRQLEQSGDEAWMYHNIRGAFFKAEWPRLVNGYYLWISPIRVHVPWMYYSFKGNPFDCTDGPRDRGGDFAYAVPDPADPSRMIPTRHWEAFREGIDDLRYLETLEGLVAARAGTPEADAAQSWLDNVRGGVTPTAEQLEPIEEESPVLVFLSRKLDGPLYRKIRRQAAEHVVRLWRLAE